MDDLKLITGWVMLVIIAGFGLTVLLKIWQGKINIDNLIGESDGSASLSRFQFLIFTFTIALSLFWVVVKQGNFVEIPAGVYGLLGISGGSYVISKSVHKPKPDGAPPTPPPSGAPPSPPPGDDTPPGS